MKERLQEMVARYAGHCAECGCSIAPNGMIVYDTKLKRTLCKACGGHVREQIPALFEENP